MLGENGLLFHYRIGCCAHDFSTCVVCGRTCCSTNQKADSIEVWTLSVLLIFLFFNFLV